jgi:hypothetical protein
VQDAPSAPDRPRQLSGPGKILLLLLVVYAVGLILPDILRPTALYRGAYYLAGLNPDAQPPSSGWYPLGIVCFTADNDGKITSVDECGPTQDQRQHQLQAGDQIDLRKTTMTDRRAVIQGGGWVPHDRLVVLQIVGTKGTLTPVSTKPYREELEFFGKTWPKTWTLMLEQLAGLFFIGLATLCVWRASTPVTWGFFLYAIYFNSGDLQVWWANLPVEALRWLGWSQAVFAGVGLVGLIMFALYFPRHSGKGWWRAALWLLIPFVALTGLNLWSFRNFTDGVPTEGVYRAYYYLFFAAYLAIFALFLRTYVTRPTDRPRIRWVILGALSGLLCFIFAEAYTQTSMLDWVPTIHVWLWQTLYAVNVLFPLAVSYAILRHRVIDIRLVLNRSFVLLFGFALVFIAFEIFELAFHKRVEHAPWIAIIGATMFGFAHERLHGVMDVMNWLFYRKWYIAKRRLEKETENLTQATHVGAVNHALIDTPAKELNLTLAGLFERQPDDSFHRTYATASWPQVVLPTIPADHPLIASLKNAPLMLSDRYWQNQMSPSYAQMPVLAVPIVIGRIMSRIALFGPHDNDETIDRDELNIIRRLGQSASLAYTTLEAEQAERLRLGAGD